MKTLYESILDADFDIKEDKEISMVLRSINWEHYVRNVFRTDDLSIYDILEKYITKFIDKKISITQAYAVCISPAMRDFGADQCILIFGRDRWSSRGQTKEEWDYIQITTPERCVRIRKYISSCDPLRIEISLPSEDCWNVKKTSIKKAFTLSNGEALTKAFYDFYEKYVK